MIKQATKRTDWQPWILIATSIRHRRCFWHSSALACIIHVAMICGSPHVRAAVYSETFSGATVPTNWNAQNGTAGTAVLSIANDSGGINSGNALSITSATRQGVIGSFPNTALINTGDSIELLFDARLTSFANNSGGFRFGLYYDNGGSPALSSGYRFLVGTGNNTPRTDIQADGGDTDIGFGTNRENPSGFLNTINGINDFDPHSYRLSLTRTTNGVLIDLLQDGISSFAAPVEHISGAGAGTPVPLQTVFNQIMFTTNGGYTGLIDNISVSYFVPGDVNGDGLVNNNDFNIILGAMFTSVGSRQQGDLTGDGFVDFRDYRIWKDTPKSGAGGGASSIPEPGTLASLTGIMIGLVICVGRRRRLQKIG